MIKLASPPRKVSPGSAWAPESGLNRLESNQWVAGNPAIENCYEFIGAPFQEMPIKNPRMRCNAVAGADPALSTPTWKVVLDGCCVLALMAIIVGVSAMLIGNMALEFATFGDARLLEHFQRGH